MTYEHAWEEMGASGGGSGAGRLQRRIHPESELDLFAAVEKPANRRLILFSVSAATLAVCSPPSPSQGVEVCLTTEPDGSGTIVLRLLEPRFGSVFSTLATDLIQAALAAPTEQAAAGAFLARWHRWQQFLQRAGTSHLDAKAEQGLVGELWMLRSHLLGRVTPLRAVSAWTGPEGAEQDFQFPDCAIEVKSSIARRPQRLVIASERQLDDTGVAVLLLFYLSLDVRRGGKTTLPDLVEELRAALARHEEALALFNDRLLAAGYLDEHRSHYEDTSYTAREERFFRVGDGFPRLTEHDLPAGVGDVSYAVDVTACLPFQVEPAELDQVLAGE